MTTATRSRKQAAEAEPEQAPATEQAPTAEPVETPAAPEQVQADPDAQDALPRSVWERLAAPFPANEIELLPKQMSKHNSTPGPCDEQHKDKNGMWCGGWHAPSVHLSYVGHAGITTRLNEAAGADGWSWEPAHVDVPTDKMPLLDAAVSAGNLDLVKYLIDTFGEPRLRDGGMWIKLTIHGVTKLGFGDAGYKKLDGSDPNATKELIGDAIRNAAMRFGVGTYLWSKSDKAKATLEQGHKPEPVDPEELVASVAAALEHNDPENALIALGNQIGKDRLDNVMVPRPDGEGECTGYELVLGWVAEVRKRAAAEVERRQQERREAAQQQGPATGEAPAESEPAPPANEPQEPSQAAAPVEQAPAQPAEEQGEPTDRERKIHAWLTEVAFQAHTLNVTPVEHIKPLLKDRKEQDPRALPLATLRAWTQTQRARAIDALHGQGRASAAHAYEEHMREQMNEPITPDAINAPQESQASGQQQ